MTGVCGARNFLDPRAFVGLCVQVLSQVFPSHLDRCGLVAAQTPASRRRLISRKGCGLSRPNLNLDGANHWRTRGSRGFEVQFQRLLQVGERTFFGFALAGDIDFQALGDVPIPLAPNGRGEWSFHDYILSHGNRPSHANPGVTWKINQRSIGFYSNVFGWKFAKWDGPAEYWIISTGTAPEPGIDGGLMRRRDPKQPCANTVGVENLEDRLSLLVGCGKGNANREPPITQQDCVLVLNAVQGLQEALSRSPCGRIPDMVDQSLRRDWVELCRRVREWGDWQNFSADHWHRAGSSAIGVEGIGVFTRGNCVVRVVWDLQSASPRMLELLLALPGGLPPFPAAVHGPSSAAGSQSNTRLTGFLTAARLPARHV